MTNLIRSGRGRRVIALSALAVAGALALSACGDDGGDAGAVNPSADLEAGKTQFTAVCGGCHQLADAGSKGLIGPNLDDAFRGARTSGFKDSQFEGVTLRWIEIANQPMPRDLVTGQDAINVAAYVASVAGKDDTAAINPIQPWISEDVQVAMPSGFRKDPFGEQSTSVNPAGGVPQTEAPPSGENP